MKRYQRCKRYLMVCVLLLLLCVSGCTKKDGPKEDEKQPTPTTAPSNDDEIKVTVGEEMVPAEIEFAVRDGYIRKDCMERELRLIDGEICAETEYQYDTYGNCTEVRSTYQGKTVIEKRTYDSYGRLLKNEVSTADAPAMVSTFGYDADGRLEKAYIALAGLDEVIETRYVYYPNGKLYYKAYYMGGAYLGQMLGEDEETTLRVVSKGYWAEEDSYAYYHSVVEDGVTIQSTYRPTEVMKLAELSGDVSCEAEQIESWECTGKETVRNLYAATWLGESFYGAIYWNISTMVSDESGKASGEWVVGTTADGVQWFDYIYNETGELLYAEASTKQGNGRTLRYFDENGRCVKVVEEYDRGSGFVPSSELRLEYTKDGMLSRAYYYDSETEESYDETLYTYDAQGRLITIETPSLAGQEIRYTVAYTYAGTEEKPTSMNLYLGYEPIDTIVYGYDSAGTVVSMLSVEAQRALLMTYEEAVSAWCVELAHAAVKDCLTISSGEVAGAIAQ